MKLNEQEIAEMEKIADQIIAKGGPTKGQIKVNSDPALVARYNELAAKLEAPDNDQSDDAPEPTPADKPEEERPLTKAEARKALLEARLRSPGKYSLAQRQSWRKELDMIARGTWTQPIPPRVHKGIYDQVVGG